MEIKEFELLKEKIQNDYSQLTEPLYNEIHVKENEKATKLADIDTQLNEIKRINKLKADIKLKLGTDTFTADEYNALPNEDKPIAIKAIFDFYAEQVNVYYGLNTLEYMLIPIIKIVGKCLDTTSLTVDEKAFFDKLILTVNQHPMVINDENTWEFNIINLIMNETIERRDSYRNKKIAVTGSF